MAPSPDIALGAINKNPPAILIRANLQMSLGFVKQGIRKATRDLRHFGLPPNLRGLQAQRESALALDQCRIYGYLQPGVQFGELFLGKGAACGTGLDQLTKKDAKLPESLQSLGITRSDSQVPVAQERTHPARIIEAFGEVAEPIP